MRRLGLATVLLLAACGGGGAEFDADALRSDLERRYPTATDHQIDAVVDTTRDTCEGDDDQTFEFVVALTLDEGTFDQLVNLKRACPDRTQAVLDKLGG